jgi:hypothetical protein
MIVERPALALPRWKPDRRGLRSLRRRGGPHSGIAYLRRGQKTGHRPDHCPWRGHRAVNGLAAAAENR